GDGFVEGGVDPVEVACRYLAGDGDRIGGQPDLGVRGDVLVAGEEGDDGGDPRFVGQPGDLLVAADSAVLEPEAADAFGDGQPIGDNPDEPAGLEARHHLCHFGFSRYSHQIG